VNQEYKDESKEGEIVADDDDECTNLWRRLHLPHNCRNSVYKGAVRGGVFVALLSQLRCSAHLSKHPPIHREQGGRKVQGHATTFLEKKYDMRDGMYTDEMNGTGG
jgi:hypothetical protein